MKKHLFSYLLLSVLTTMSIAGEKVGMYEYVIQQCKLDFESASFALEPAPQENELEFLGVTNRTAPKECGFKTRVFAVSNSNYSEHLVKTNSLTGPFAAVDRLNFFEDEKGLHVSIVNPQNILRTVLLGDEAVDKIAAERRMLLRSVYWLR